MKRKPGISMHRAALTIARTLREAGHTALFAGGCVRDMLMHHRPADYDIATDAPPDRIMALFRRTRKVGVKFGVVIVGIGRHWIEVATFRSDASYSDGRHPDGITFADAKEDALRRDFTINGMFYDPLAREVIDYVDGRADIRARRIRAIGDPARRFAEDHLRMLRAVRFSARFGFAIEPATLAAIGEHAARIARVSPERICDELDAMLSHPARAAAWRGIVDAALLPHLWPGAAELAPHAETIARRLKALPPDAAFPLALAAVLAPLAHPRITAACRALRTSNHVRQTVLWLVENLPRAAEPGRLSLADLKLLMARPAFPDLLALLAADLAASGRPPDPHDALARRAAAIAPREVAPPPLLTGDDLARLNVPQGPIYSRILEQVYYAQLNNNLPDREAALALARQLLSSANP